MSTQINTYVMVGFKLRYKDYSSDEWHDKLEPYMDSAFKGIQHHHGLCCLYDGMCGEYVIIGRVLAKSGNHEGFDKPVIPDLTVDLRSEVEQSIWEELEIDHEDGAELIVVSHYR